MVHIRRLREKMKDSFKSPKTFLGEYGNPKESDSKNKTKLSYNYVVSDYSDKETIIGFQILNELLMGDNFSPLRKALEDKKTIELKEKLVKYKSSLSDEEINNLVNQTKELRQWSDTPGSQEALSKLPYLTKKDIDIKVSNFPIEVKERDKVKILYHSVPLDGIADITFYFDTKSIPQDKLSYINLLSSILNDIDIEV